MNKAILCAGILALLSSAAIADTPPTTSGKKGSGPCGQIVQACKGAGFVKGEWKEGKGLYKDCVDPILAGKSVPGVTVDASLIPACNEVRANRKQNKNKQ